MALKYSFGVAGYDLFIYASEKCKEKFNLEANEKYGIASLTIPIIQLL